MKQYCIRFFKYLIYYVVIIALILGISWLVTDHAPGATFWSLIQKGKMVYLISFLVVMAAAYPLIGFRKHSIPLSHPFAQDRDAIIKLFDNARFMLVADDDHTLTFRPKNSFARLMRVYEDKVVLDYSDDQMLVINGLQRETDRFARQIDYYLRQQEKESEF